MVGEQATDSTSGEAIHVVSPINLSEGLSMQAAGRKLGVIQEEIVLITEELPK